MQHKENILIWLSQWYQNQCDGDWEHSYGITITTLDNPGWNIKIETIDSLSILKDTPWESLENSDFDWYWFRIENGVFDASGDPSKLLFLLEKFRELIENTNNLII